MGCREFFFILLLMFFLHLATFVFVFKKFEGEVFFVSGWQRGAEKSGAGAGIENWTSLHILTIASHFLLFSFSFLCISFIFRPPPPTFLLFLSFFGALNSYSDPLTSRFFASWTCALILENGNLLTSQEIRILELLLLSLELS